MEKNKKNKLIKILPPSDSFKRTISILSFLDSELPLEKCGSYLKKSKTKKKKIQNKN